MSLKLKLKKAFIMISFVVVICGFGLQLEGCATKPPNNVQNVCSIFKEYKVWYWDAQEVRRRWGLPIYVLMAIIYQESRFRANAAPPREKILWIIPWKRPTSAYGYSQALDGTWKHYKKDTGKHWWNTRDAFGGAADFVGWYVNYAHERAGVSKTNAYQAYLAYHEGVGGYQRKTYLKKPWLVAVAKKVQRRAWIYRVQLQRCQGSLPNKPWYRFW
jgi:hypothetical protein